MNHGGTYFKANLIDTFLCNCEMTIVAKAAKARNTKRAIDSFTARFGGWKISS
jgi:hypothetical protein